MNEERYVVKFPPCERLCCLLTRLICDLITKRSCQTETPTFTAEERTRLRADLLEFASNDGRITGIRDAVFSASPSFIWDAARINLPGGKTARLGNVSLAAVPNDRGAEPNLHLKVNLCQTP
jgi:hypothetical protein